MDVCMYVGVYIYMYSCTYPASPAPADISALVDMARGGGLGSRPKKMYGERLGDGVEYHLMKPTPRR